VMFVQLLWVGDKANKSLGLDDDLLPQADHIFYALEIFFCSVFLVELVMLTLAENNCKHELEVQKHEHGPHQCCKAMDHRGKDNAQSFT